MTVCVVQLPREVVGAIACYMLQALPALGWLQFLLLGVPTTLPAVTLCECVSASCRDEGIWRRR